MAATNNQKWTIYDIAREAGVSAKTVSRVLNQKDGVSNETRSRVLGIMARVNFHPHIGARTMRGRDQGCVGVTIPAPMDEVPLSQGFFIWLFAKLYDLFGARGDYLCFDLNPYSSESDYARGVWQQLYKACIVAGPLAVDDETIKRIHASGMPYLALGRLDSLPECSSATVDYVHGTFVSTKYLLDRGHKRVAMLKAFHGFQPGVERIQGYTKALQEADIPMDAKLIRTVKFGPHDIATTVHRLLVDPTVTALVDCSATEDGSAIREGARRAGRVPGKDFEIVAWTYMDNVAVLHEACAHLWLPVREACSEGLERLADWTHGGSKGPIHVLYRAILREKITNGELAKPRRLFDQIE